MTAKTGRAFNDKVEQRALARRYRKDAAAASPDAAARAAGYAESMLEALFATTGGFADEIRRGRRLAVALYTAQGSEMETRPLAEALRALDVTLALPVVLQRAAALSFRRWTPGDPLEPDLAGCPAPLDLATMIDPDLIVTPLLAFDRFGGRLGQGGGYYDRTFAARPDAARVGLAYAGQEVEVLILEPHDMRLHGVLTEVGYTPALWERTAR